MKLSVKAAKCYIRLQVAQAKFQSMPSALDAAVLPQLESLVERQYALEEKILASELSDRVNIPPGTLQEAWLKVQADYATPDAFESALEQAELSEAEYEAAIHRALVLEAILEKVAAGAPPATDAEVAAWYAKNAEQFQQPEKREARHLLITVNEQTEQESDSQVLARMHSLRAELQPLEETRFAELALKHSQCPTALEGGRLGKIPPGVLYPELDAALFTLDAGELSQPLRSPLGYHLVWCEQIIPAQTHTLEAVKESLAERIQEQRRQQIQKRWIQSL